MATTHEKFREEVALLTNGDRPIDEAARILSRAMRAAYRDSEGRETYIEFLARVVQQIRVIAYGQV